MGGDQENSDRLAKAVRDYFHKLREDLPNTPFLLLSSLTDPIEVLIDQTALDISAQAPDTPQTKSVVVLSQPRAADDQSADSGLPLTSTPPPSLIANHPYLDPSEVGPDVQTPGAVKNLRLVAEILIARSCQFLLSVYNDATESSIPGSGIRTFRGSRSSA